MKPRNEQTTADTKKPRFAIEKLEERIAPAAHYNPQGKLVGGGRGYHYHYPGHCTYNNRTGGYDC